MGEIQGFRDRSDWIAHAKATGGVVCMPLRSNVRHMDDAVVVPCPRCGKPCWQRLNLPVELSATCTHCALIIAKAYSKAEEQADGN